MGNLEVLEWAEDSDYRLKNILGADTMAEVAKNGHFRVIRYLKKVGVSWDKWMCPFTAASGNLVVLKWTREHHCPWDECKLEVLKWLRKHQCPWNEDTCAYAQENGNLEVPKWLREHPCP